MLSMPQFVGIRYILSFVVKMYAQMIVLLLKLFFFLFIPLLDGGT